MGEIVVGRGARATEAFLLDAVAGFAAQVRLDPARLASPLRIVVPSRSLREHVAARIVATTGAVAGVTVQTLYSLALDVLASAGERPPRGDALLPLLVRRFAREEPALQRALDALDDGYGAVVGAVNDLLDAGFGPELLDPASETLDESAWPERRERARAVLRVAARSARALSERECGRMGAPLRQAKDIVLARGWPLRDRVWVHGFADATELAGDWIEALLRHADATVLLDEPPDPLDPGRADVGVAFGARLRERLESVVGAARRPPDAAAPPPQLDGIEASGAFSEARAVAEALREQLDAGAAPERLAVVARDLTGYAVPLRMHLGRLGVPFSGMSATAPPDGTRRRLQAFLALLGEGPFAPADRWVDARRGSRPRLADLRLALHAVGAARLGDVAALDADALLDGRKGIPLPARRGLSETPDGDGPSLRRRYLHADELRRAVERGARLVSRLEACAERAPFAAHRERLRAAAQEDLGWSGAAREWVLLARALEDLEAGLPEGLELVLEELVLLLRRTLSDAGLAPLGGRGAGVQLLGVVEARARTFDRVFLVGMNRDVFPRPILDDPVLPDDARRSLETVLPSIPIKARGADEERYLFAQLLSASPAVTLSWQVADDDGRARSASPLVEGLRLDEKQVRRAAGLHAPSGSAPPPRTAAEALLVEGLHGTRERVAALLPSALAEVGAAAPGAEAEALAAGRRSVVRELDNGSSRELGPYFGFVGPVRLPLDPRHRGLAITHVERIAECPWRHLLGRLLGLEPPPDALERLPSLTPLLVGSVVHGVLEDLARAAGCASGSLEEAVGREPRFIAWPAPDELEERLRTAAQEVLRAEGLGPPVFADLLAERARPLVERARELGWPHPGGAIGCLGVEVTGSLALPDGESPFDAVSFRADRVDRVDGPQGGLRLVDYKAGKPKARLAPNLVQGKLLQAPAYALGAPGEGRYLYLRTEEDDGVLGMDFDDGENAAHFRDTLGRVLGAARHGSFFPRLSKGKEVERPRVCSEWCEVREACIQGDARARRRLHDWTREGAAETPAEQAVRSLWPVPERSP